MYLFGAEIVHFIVQNVGRNISTLCAFKHIFVLQNVGRNTYILGAKYLF